MDGFPFPRVLLCLVVLIVRLADASRCTEFVSVVPRSSHLTGCWDFDNTTSLTAFLRDGTGNGNNMVNVLPVSPIYTAPATTTGNALYCGGAVSPCRLYIPTTVFTGGGVEPLDGFTISSRIRIPDMERGDSYLSIQSQVGQPLNNYGRITFYDQTAGITHRVGIFGNDAIGCGYVIRSYPVDPTGGGRFVRVTFSGFRNATQNRTCARVVVDDSTMMDTCTCDQNVNELNPYFVMPGATSRGISIGYKGVYQDVMMKFELDDVLVWRVPLTIAEIHTMHNVTDPGLDPALGGNATTPGAHWPLKGDLVNTVAGSQLQNMYRIEREIIGFTYNATPGYYFVNGGTSNGYMVGDLGAFVCSRGTLAVSHAFTICSTMKLVTGSNTPVNLPFVGGHVPNIYRRPSNATTATVDTRPSTIGMHTGYSNPVQGAYPNASGTIRFCQSCPNDVTLSDVISTSWRRICQVTTVSVPKASIVVTWTKDGLPIYNTTFGDLSFPFWKDSAVCTPMSESVAIRDLVVYPRSLSDAQLATDSSTYAFTDPTPSPTSPGATNPPTLSPSNAPTYHASVVPTMVLPTSTPTPVPTALPTSIPTALPTATPTAKPTGMPTAAPSTATPTRTPTSVPSTSTPTMTSGPTVAPPTGSPTAIVTEGVFIVVGPEIPIGSGIGGGGNGTSGTRANPEIGTSDGLGVDNSTTRYDMQTSVPSDPPFILTVNSAHGNVTSGIVVQIRPYASNETRALSEICGPLPDGLVPIAAVLITGDSPSPPGPLRVHLELPGSLWTTVYRDAIVCDTRVSTWKTAAKMCTDRLMDSAVSVYVRSVAVTSCRFEPLVFVENAKKDRLCIDGSDCECSGRADRTRTVTLPAISAFFAFLAMAVPLRAAFFLGFPHRSIDSSKAERIPAVFVFLVPVLETISAIVFGASMILLPDGDIGPSMFGNEPSVGETKDVLFGLGIVLIVLSGLPFAVVYREYDTFASIGKVVTVTFFCVTFTSILMVVSVTSGLLEFWLTIGFLTAAFFVTIPVVLAPTKDPRATYRFVHPYAVARLIFFGAAYTSTALALLPSPCRDGLRSDTVTAYGSV